MREFLRVNLGDRVFVHLRQLCREFAYRTRQKKRVDQRDDRYQHKRDHIRRQHDPFDIAQQLRLLRDVERERQRALSVVKGLAERVKIAAAHALLGKLRGSCPHEAFNALRLVLRQHHAWISGDQRGVGKHSALDLRVDTRFDQAINQIRKRKNQRGKERQQLERELGS